MSNVTDISTHKEYHPVYRGVASRVKDKQKLMNQSFLNITDLSGSDFDVAVGEPDIAKMRTDAIKEYNMIASWFDGDE